MRPNSPPRRADADRESERDPANLALLPVTYQAINDLFAKLGEVNPFLLRKETMVRIERLTGRPILSCVARTHNVPQGVLTGIDDSDLVGFADLLHGIEGPAADVFIVSNGGSAEATERIVRLLRERFEEVRFIVPSNAFSAATLLCFAGDEILMGNLT